MSTEELPPAAAGDAAAHDAGAVVAGEGSASEDAGTGSEAGAAPFDEQTKRIVSSLPLLKTRAGPRDGEAWTQRLKEEYQALIQYVKYNKENDNDWFTIKSDKTGTKWEGKCWYYYESAKYEFDVCFDMPVTYPATAPEIRIPELDGKTVKMYHGGKICLTVHFAPLWRKNVPRFGVAHALAMGLGPWLAAEVPDLVGRGVVAPR